MLRLELYKNLLQLTEAQLQSSARTTSKVALAPMIGAHPLLAELEDIARLVGCHASKLAAVESPPKLYRIQP